MEARIKRLEEILTRMESDDVSLEEAMELFEEGVGHVRRAERILSETELRVEELLSGDRTEPMALDDS
jgi:exodeoxyribonuclease VII small subunit